MAQWVARRQQVNVAVNRSTLLIRRVAGAGMKLKSLRVGHFACVRLCALGYGQGYYPFGATCDSSAHRHVRIINKGVHKREEELGRRVNGSH